MDSYGFLWLILTRHFVRPDIKTMKMVTISEAKSKLSALIESAEHGEQVLILRGSRPAVTLIPINRPPALDRTC